MGKCDTFIVKHLLISLGGVKVDTVAKNYIDLTEKWENTDKLIVINNLERVFGDADVLKRNKDNTRREVLSKITSVDAQTIRAWMNKSRMNVKIPLLKLCMIAEALKMDVDVLLSDRGDWRKEPAINDWLVSVFEKLRMNQYYRLDMGWDIDSFVNDMHKYEMYNGLSEKEKVDALIRDCQLYFEMVVGIKDADIQNKIIKVAEKIH